MCSGERVVLMMTLRSPRNELIARRSIEENSSAEVRWAIDRERLRLGVAFF